MLRIEKKQYSLHSALYSKIPKDHILKAIAEKVDFSFINKLLEDRYSKVNGRPAKEPEMMMKLLFLQYVYNLSDVRVIERATTDLVFLWFLGLNPEDQLPDASLLAKFRTQRLEENTLDEVITEIVSQCVDKGIIKGDAISIDSTHIDANCRRKIPERLMKYLAERIFRGLTQDINEIPAEVDTKIPNFENIEDHKEAKAVMKGYLENVIEQAQRYAGENTQTAISEAKEILSDEKFMIQKGIRSLTDKDARIGHKDKSSNFFGYKGEFMMTTDERIITSVDVMSGESIDGNDFDGLMERTAAGDVKIKEVYGDKAYFRKNILTRLEKDGITPYIPVSACNYRIDDEIFVSYNKDSDEWFCVMGNRSVSKRYNPENPGKGRRANYVYTFDRNQCAGCPIRDKCMGKSRNRSRKLKVGVDATSFYAYDQRQKDPEFKIKYKKRAAHEWKNGEMKRFHGMARARGRGLKSVTCQVKLTAIAVNLKRIASIVLTKDGDSTIAACYVKLCAKIARVLSHLVYLIRLDGDNNRLLREAL